MNRNITGVWTGANQCHEQGREQRHFQGGIRIFFSFTWTCFTYYTWTYIHSFTLTLSREILIYSYVKMFIISTNSLNDDAYDIQLFLIIDNETYLCPGRSVIISLCDMMHISCNYSLLLKVKHSYDLVGRSVIISLSIGALVLNLFFMWIFKLGGEIWWMMKRKNFLSRNLDAAAKRFFNLDSHNNTHTIEKV